MKVFWCLKKGPDEVPRLMLFPSLCFFVWGGGQRKWKGWITWAGSIATTWVGLRLIHHFRIMLDTFWLLSAGASSCNWSICRAVPQMLLTENQRSQMQNGGWNKRYCIIFKRAFKTYMITLKIFIHYMIYVHLTLYIYFREICPILKFFLMQSGDILWSPVKFYPAGELTVCIVWDVVLHRWTPVSIARGAEVWVELVMHEAKVRGWWSDKRIDGANFRCCRWHLLDLVVVVVVVVVAVAVVVVAAAGAGGAAGTAGSGGLGRGRPGWLQQKLPYS